MSENVSDLPVILVVDDSKVIRKAAIKMLGEGYQVLEAVDGADAWQQLQENKSIAIIFLDLSMPIMSGTELLDKIRSSDDEEILVLPVVIMTGHGDTETAKREVFDKGATDFITKPFESIDLLSRAKSYAGFSRKVVELEKKSIHDNLTGLYNLASFEEAGSKSLSFSQRHKVHITTAYFEIDDFQSIYKRQGKGVARQILLTVSKRIENIMRTEDIAARVGVAKFAVLLPMTSQVKSLIVIGRISDLIKKLVFDTGKEKIRVSLSSGYSSLAHDKAVDFKDMMVQADDALSRAMSKATGDSIVGYREAEVAKEKSDVTDDQLQQAMGLILQGDYFQIDENVLLPLVERLTPFIDYVKNQDESVDKPEIH